MGGFPLWRSDCALHIRFCIKKALSLFPSIIIGAPSITHGFHLWRRELPTDFSWVKTRTLQHVKNKGDGGASCAIKSPNKIRFHDTPTKQNRSDNPMLKPNATLRDWFSPGSLSLRLKATHIPSGVYGTRTNRVELLDDLDIEQQTNVRLFDFERNLCGQGKLKKNSGVEP